MTTAIKTKESDPTPAEVQERGCSPLPEDAALELDRSEERRLDELEGIIERGLETFLEVGQALMEVRDSKLYRETHETFETYCRERWDFSGRRARQLMSAAKIGTVVPLENEAQARAFGAFGTQLQPSAIREIWNESVRMANAKVNGTTGVVTAETIRWAAQKRMKTGSKETEFSMKLSPKGRWGPDEVRKRKSSVNIPASIEAHDRAQDASDEIRLVLGPWTADGRLPERRRVPETNTVRAWREKLNGNGSAPPSAEWVRRLRRLASELPEGIDGASVLKLLDQIRAGLDVAAKDGVVRETPRRWSLRSLFTRTTKED